MSSIHFTEARRKPEQEKNDSIDISAHILSKFTILVMKKYRNHVILDCLIDSRILQK